MQGYLFHYTVTAYFTDTKACDVHEPHDSQGWETNQWDSVDIAEIDNTPHAKAENEYKPYIRTYMKFKYLPEMKPV
jgi:hypothetical protein